METTNVKAVNSWDLSNSPTGVEGGRFQRAKVWARELYAYAADKILPTVEDTYRTNKTWCDRLGVGVVVVGTYTGFIPFSWLLVGGVGLSSGVLVGRGSMEGGGDSEVRVSDSAHRRLMSQVPSKDASCREGHGCSENRGCTEEELAKLMVVIDGLLKTFSDLDLMADDMTSAKTIDELKKLHSEALVKQGKEVESLPYEKDLKVAFRFARNLKPRNLITLLRAVSGVRLAGENISEVVYRSILEGEYSNRSSEIIRTGRADYQKLARSVLDSGREGSHDDESLLEALDTQADLLHGITAPWNINGETRAHELMDGLLVNGRIVRTKWKASRSKVDSIHSS